MNLESLDNQPLPGFANPVHDSQRVFRAVLDALSHPGKVVTIKGLADAPPPLHKATSAICLSLVDFETPLWTDAAISASGQAMAHLRFHCGCPVTIKPGEARAALLSDIAALTSLAHFNAGTDERPDLSTTVIVQVADLAMGAGVRLTGPGIKGETHLHVAGADAAFWDQVRANTASFPRGVDLILAVDNAIACLPRTTQVEI